jgi:hypothetical protein
MVPARTIKQECEGGRDRERERGVDGMRMHCTFPG